MTEATTSTKIPVTMEDGTVVEFNAKQKLIKTSTIDEATGAIGLRLDFVNGAVRNFSVPAALLLRFAAHGAEQKLGDAIAGEKEIADAVLSIDDLITRLNAGDWTVRREAGAFAGTSILIQALVEASGKPVDAIRDFLSTKSQTEKLALRKSDKLKPIIERLEAAKATKSKNTVDTDSLLGELGLGGEPAPAAKSKKSAEA